MPNKYPLWKNICLCVLVVIGLLYAAPNLFGDNPAVQITANETNLLTPAVLTQIQQRLTGANLEPLSYETANHSELIRFQDTDSQLKAQESLKGLLNDSYTVALNLAPATPKWLQALGANPMKLGLDLRGGIHLTLDVDIDGAIQQRIQGIQHGVGDELRNARIRYSQISQRGDTLFLSFPNQNTLDAARGLLQSHFRELVLSPSNRAVAFEIVAQVSPESLTDIRTTIVDQTMTTLRNRINELGISEATVQQVGLNRIAVEMPGVLDSARAKEILGGTATLEFRMADTEHDASAAAQGMVPPGSSFYNYEGVPTLLKNQIILGGNAITDAQASFDESGNAAVDISLGGGGEALFHRTTAQNIGKPMAIVYVENKMTEKTVQGVVTKVHSQQERVISVATIHSALGNHFQITGLKSSLEAQNLSLMLRAGALPTAVSIIEERTLGPKLGAENIHKGILSVEIGMLIVIVFMALYYRVFGLIADLALVINLVLLVALLSMLGMTLTLPGIAGIVLTVGMAVDANVLIYERIREELRLGASIQASINAGYSRAFTTIVDANITTLIVALILFSVGTGPVKGFAVTLSAGIITSMLSAIAITRAMVNGLYGRANVKTIAIGVHLP